MKKIIQKILKILAKLILKRYQPKIIAITGSVGKTGTKDAINYILQDNFFVRTNPKNYNNEFGLPLTIIGSMSPGRSFWGWFKIILKAIFLIIIKQKYPEILILEMGIDRPNDMDYLTSIVKPDIAVVTAVSHSHFEFFSSLEDIKEEKQKLVENTKNNGLVILNQDDSLVLSMKDVSSTQTLTYGFNEDSDLKVFDLIFRSLENENYFGGLHIKLNYKGSVVPMQLNKTLNESGLYAIIAAILVALNLDLNLVTIIEKFKNFSLPAGRMNYLKGINDSHIIDDSYNASPASVCLALKTFNKLKFSFKKYVVLGDILEIGDYKKTGFNLIAKEIKNAKIDLVLLKGDLIKDLKQELENIFYPNDKIKLFSSHEDLSEFLKDNLSKNDIVLIKGSQGARMEKIVKKILKNPLDTSSLVRQDKEWQE